MTAITPSVLEVFRPRGQSHEGLLMAVPQTCSVLNISGYAIPRNSAYIEVGRKYVPTDDI